MNFCLELTTIIIQSMVTCIFMFGKAYNILYYVHTSSVPSAHIGKKRDLDILELELHMVMNSHVDPRNQAGIFLKSRKCF